MKLYKLKDLVEVLSTPLYTLQNWARTGYIPAFKVAQSWCVRESDLDKWLEDLKEKGAPTPSSEDLDISQNLASESEVV